MKKIKTNIIGKNELKEEKIINLFAKLRNGAGYLQYCIKNKVNSEYIRNNGMENIIKPVEDRIKEMNIEEIIKFVLSTQYLDESFFQKDNLLKLFRQDVNYLKDANREKMDYKINKEFENEFEKEAYKILNYNLLRELNGSRAGEDKDIEYFSKLSMFKGIWDNKTDRFMPVSKYIKNKYKEKYYFCYRILMEKLDTKARYKLFYEMSKNKKVLEVLDF